MSEPIISVMGVSKSFKLPHEKHTGLKQALLNFSFGKKYEEQKALEGVSFDVRKGEFIGIVGRNGSGKSTLLKLLAQIYTPDKGALSVSGSLTPFIELGVGFNPELTGRENVYLNGALLGFDRGQMDEMYKEIVDFAELQRFMDQKLKNYSSGMQVRLAFSIAIRSKSDILLVDEVLAVGDAAFQQKCYNYFEKLKNQDTTVVLVTHDMGAVQRFCDKAININDGKITHIGKPSEIAEAYTMENLEGANINDRPSSKTHGISATVVSNVENRLSLSFAFKAPATEGVYVGISLIKDGITVAEINTLKQLKLKGSGKVSYALDTKQLNSGVYEISSALLRVKNKAPLALSNRVNFIVTGEDPTKAGALKLQDAWSSNAKS